MDGVVTTFLSNPTVLAMLAGSPTGIGAVWVVYRFLLERRDKQREADENRELTRDERRQKEMDALFSTLTAQQMQRVTDYQAENKELRADNALLRREIDRVWDLARFWHGKAHDLLREFRNLRHNALNMQQWINSAVKTYKIDMPVSIEPIPDRPNLPLGLEEAGK